jgi:hypothetical protein
MEPGEVDGGYFLKQPSAERFQDRLPIGTQKLHPQGLCHAGPQIVGGGAAGITVAARLKRARPSLDVTILEPAS